MYFQHVRSTKNSKNSLSVVFKFQKERRKISESIGKQHCFNNSFWNSHSTEDESKGKAKWKSEINLNLPEYKDKLWIFLGSINFLNKDHVQDTITCRMDKRPVLISRICDTATKWGIWKRNHFTLGYGIYCVTAYCANLSSFRDKQHVIRPQKFDEP